MNGNKWKIAHGGGVVQCFCWSPQVNMENIEHLPGEYTSFLLVSKKIGGVSLDENRRSLVPVHQESMAGNCKLQNWPAYWHEIAIGESHFDAKYHQKNTTTSKIFIHFSVKSWVWKTCILCKSLVLMIFRCKHL